MGLKYLMTGFIILSALTLLYGADAEAISWESGLDSALSAAETSGELIMVDFYTDWCGWCKKLDNDTYADSKVQDLARNFRCVKINGDSDKETVRKYNVSGYPTILFLNPKGTVIGSIIGYSPPGPFASKMEGILKKYAPQKEKEGSKQKTAAGPGKSSQPKKEEAKFSIEELRARLKKKVEKIKNHNLELSGIIYDSKYPKAIINDKIVRAGDEIEGSRVISIGKDNVELLLIKENKKITLTAK